VLIVVGVYAHNRWRVYRAVLDVPRKLGVNIQQSTDGFSLSKSEGGKTIFTIRASNVQYQRGGRAQLRKVQIIVYGRSADRFDRIYGEQFDYDPGSGNIAATGEVRIDLQPQGKQNATDSSAPGGSKESIHLKTSGLIFNQKSGIATTSQRIEVNTPQARGSAQGIIYDSKDATITLLSAVEIQGDGADPVNLTARRATVTQRSGQAVLEGAHIHRGPQDIVAERVMVYLLPNNTIERVVATGNVQATAADKLRMVVHSPRAEARMHEGKALSEATFSGGVLMSASGERTMNASAGRVNLQFGGMSVLQRVVATENVHWAQKPGKDATGREQSFEISAPALNFEVAQGRELERAVTSGGSAQIVFRQAGGGPDGTTTVATAGGFTADFNPGSKLRRITGFPDARVVDTAMGKPDRVTSSDRLEVLLNPSGGIQEIVETGNFQYREGRNIAGASNANGPVMRSAFAQRASFDLATDSLILSGSPRIVQDGISTTAERIRVVRRSGEAVAEGEVKTTYSDLRRQPGGALLAAADPIHVTAARMKASQEGGLAEYSGGARLWQGANVIQAPFLEFSRDKRSVVANSGGTQGKGTPGTVRTVLVQQDKSGKMTPVVISSARLSYIDSERRLRFDGGVMIKGAESEVTADQVDVMVQPKGQTATTGNSGTQAGPDKVDKIVATGGVVVQANQRQARGEKLVYTPEDTRFLLTGGNPSIFDAERGKITGDSLTFFSRDGRVLVESNSIPAVTQTRVAK
jgi:lipopolysaccharide export system protein LptA